MAFLTDGRFWGGVVAAYLLLMFFPQLSLRGKMSAKAGA